jgi:hypothetical protein
MKYILYILIFGKILFNSTSDCFANSKVSNDSLIVIGKLFDGQNGQFVTTGLIEVNGNKFEIEPSGDFNITIPKESTLQITIKSVGYRPLMIKYSQISSDKVDLEKVLMFQGSMTFINYECRSWQLLCKYHRSRHSKGLDRDTRKERIKSNEMIEKFNYHFQGNEYPFRCNKKNDLVTIEIY